MTQVCQEGILSHPICHTCHTMPTIRKRGDSWQAIVRVKRDQTLIHQESKTFPTERLARDWGERVEAAIRKTGPAARQLQLQTLGDLIEKYRQVRSGIKPLRRSMEHELAFLSGHFRSVKLSELTSEMFTRFAVTRRDQGAGPATVMHNLATIRAILNAARPMFGLETDGDEVAHAIKALGTIGAVSRSQSRSRRVSDEEIARLCAEFERIANNPSTIIPMATIVPLAVYLPRRRTELCEMRWEDYSSKSGLVVLRDTKNPKAPRTETVPVPPLAREIIDSLPVIDERILPYNAESVSAAFERACERLGLVDLRFHDLRHEGISRLFEMGLDIPEVSSISGHMSWSMLKRYTHLKPATVLEKLNASRQKAQKTDPQPS